MRETSALYKALRNQPGYHYEVNVVCNNTATVYGMSDLRSVHIKPMLFVENGPSIGNACSAECDIVLRESSENWPRMAEYEVKVRVKSEDNSQYSEWLTLGTYFTDERSYTVSGDLSITGFDGMLRMETSWTDKITPPASWPITAKAWCDLIENDGLAEFDTRSDINNSVAFVGLDTTSTVRDKLKDIAAAHGGNFVMTPEGKLRLIPFTNTIIYDTGAIAGIAVAGIAIVGTTGDSSVNPNYSFLGMNCRSFSKSTPLNAVTGTELQTEAGTKTTAGTDTGYVLKGNCNFASTNGVAALCLSRSSGYVYRGFESDTAYLDPASEPGDLVLFEDVAYQIMSLEWNINHRPTANISAPYEEEIDHEYEYLSESAKYYQKSAAKTEQLENRVVSAETSIDQNADRIRMLAKTVDYAPATESENIMTYPLVSGGGSITHKGLEFIYNEDGSITIKGTTTENVFYQFALGTSHNDGDYLISVETPVDFNVSTSSSSPFAVLITETGENDRYVYLASTTLSNKKVYSSVETFTNTGYIYMYFSVNSGLSIYATIYPMVAESNALIDWQPPIGAETSDKLIAIESEIQQNSENITLKVSKDSVISEINQSSESVTINANKLNLIGYITATDVGASGSTVIDGSRIYGGTLTLGGVNNENGLLDIKDENDNLIIRGSKDGINVYNGATISGPKIVGGQTVGTTIVLKGSRTGDADSLTMSSGSSTTLGSYYSIRNAGYGSLTISLNGVGSDYGLTLYGGTGATIGTSYNGYHIDINTSGIHFYRGSTLLESWT